MLDTMVNDDEFPVLSHFLGAYLHEDWADEFTDVWQALSVWLTETPRASRMPGEIDQLLGSIHGEADLEEALFDLGSAYSPELRGESARSWLEEVRRRAEAHLAGS